MIHCAGLSDYACLAFAGRPQRLYCGCNDKEHYNGSQCLTGPSPCTPVQSCPVCKVSIPKTTDCKCPFGKKLHPFIGLDQTLKLDKDICGEFLYAVSLHRPWTQKSCLCTFTNNLRTISFCSQMPGNMRSKIYVVHPSLFSFWPQNKTKYIFFQQSFLS